MALLLICLFAAFFFIDAEAFLSNPVVTQWAAAIATFSAAVVAIGIALHGQAQATKERRRAAKLSSASHYGAVRRIQHFVAHASKTTQTDIEQRFTAKVMGWISKARSIEASLPLNDFYDYEPMLAAHCVNVRDLLGVCELSTSSPIDASETVYSSAIVKALYSCQQMSKIMLEARISVFDGTTHPVQSDLPNEMA
ncbi:hypothetical protein [Achromobacter marplatensis]|uniref:hypothetical protein n=1 Tax=Achromobacter marplatensis TaxID=470868 RepID=UPI003D05E135